MNKLWTELLRAMGQSEGGSGTQEIPGVPPNAQKNQNDSTAMGETSIVGAIQMPGAKASSRGDALSGLETAGISLVPQTGATASPEVNGGTPLGDSQSRVTADSTVSSQAGITVPSGASSDAPLIDSLSRLTAGIEQLRLTSSTQVDTLTENTQAVSQNTTAQSSKSGSSVGSTLSKIFSPILSMTGISPIVSGLVNLFGGGEQAPQPALTPYVAPSPIQYYGVISAAPRAANSPASSSSGNSGNVAQTGTSSAPASTVQINVQAMDSKSFLDHSDEIASAVRDALLRSHPLGDVINED